MKVNYHDLVQECKSVHGNDYGQTAVKVQNCLKTHSKQKLLAKGVKDRDIGYGHSDSVLAKIMEQTAECTDEMGEEKSAQIPHYGSYEPLPEDNSALNEFMGCLWRKLGIIDEKSVLNEVKLENHIAYLSSLSIKPDDKMEIQRIK